MRITSALTLLVAGAGLALEQVSASPIRVVVVTSHQELSASGTGPLRIGHAAANAHPEIAMIKRPQLIASELAFSGSNRTHHAHKHFCGKLREKAIAMSNGLRKMFGMPLIESHPVHVHHEHRHKQHLPQSHVENNEDVEGGVRVMGWVEKGNMNSDNTTDEDVSSVVRVPDGRVRRIGMRCHRAPFLRRIHRALMTLGPWEGRAVAFVLGCGIGVIFRMIWVMAVVTYRLIKGRRESEEYEYAIVYDGDAEDLLVPPPQYTDEKVALVDAKEAPAPTTEA